jgi:two-component system OmpR family sensor kinase
VTVSIATDPDADATTLVVEDDGPGYPEELLVHGVDRFTPGDSPDTHGGAGLGLAIVGEIVVAHGGTVALGNQPPSGGARAVLQLPATAESRLTT